MFLPASPRRPESRCSVTPKWAAVEASGMAGDEDDQHHYDPSRPTPPEREPPSRQTAPQSEYTPRQVAFGFVLLLVGLVVTVGLPLLFT